MNSSVFFLSEEAKEGEGSCSLREQFYIYIFLGPIFIVPSFGNTMIIVSVYFLEYLVDDEIRMVCGKLVR